MSNSQLSKQWPVHSTACCYLAYFALEILIPILLPMCLYCQYPSYFISIVGAFVNLAQL